MCTLVQPGYRTFLIFHPKTILIVFHFNLMNIIYQSFIYFLTPQKPAILTGICRLSIYTATKEMKKNENTQTQMYICTQTHTHKIYAIVTGRTYKTFRQKNYLFIGQQSNHIFLSLLSVLDHALCFKQHYHSPFLPLARFLVFFSPGDTLLWMAHS